MFSRRSAWDLRANRLARALQRLRTAGRPPLDLTLSNPTRAGLGAPKRLCQVLTRACPETYAPEPFGLAAARAAVAAYYRAGELQVSPERVVLTASTSEAYAYLFKLLTDPGDNILVPRPSYPLLEYLAGLESVHTRGYPLRYSDGCWEVDVDRMAAALDARTRAIVAVSPNNPTGSYLGARDHQMVVQLARERGLALIVDEVFSDYALAPAVDVPAPFVSGAEVLTFSLTGLSKILAAPQLKLSWMVVDGPAAQRRDAMARLELIADTYLSVGTQVQLALPDLMDLRTAVQGPILRRLRTHLAGLHAACAGHGRVQALAVEGGWYAVLRVCRDEEHVALSLLKETGVLVQPGYFFDFPTQGHLVLSLLTPDFQEGLERILAHLDARPDAAPGPPATG